MSSAAGTWQVLLGGSFKDYEATVQQALEAAYTRGDAATDVTVRGTVYEVTLQGDALQQRQKNDPTRTRQVRRVPPPAAAKRSADGEPDAAPPAKVAAPAPAAPNAAPTPPAAAPAPTPPRATSLRGVACPPGWGVVGGSLLVLEFQDPKPAAKVAAFDFDGCVARTSLQGSDPNAWSMMFSHVPAVLQRLHADGFKIVIVSNESMDRLVKPDAIANAIKKKTGRLHAFVRAVDVPTLVLCATAKDSYRKPATGAWDWMAAHANGGVAIDRAASLFVGDAAGRAATGDRPKDFSDSDRVFAANVGVPFHTETAFFTQLHKA